MALVMGLSFAVNYLLLRGTERISGKYTGAGRLLTASLLGAAYAGACMLPRLRFLQGAVWRLTALAATSVLAFGMERDTWRTGGIFLLLTMALDGTALAVGRGENTMLLVYAAGIRLMPVGIRGSARRLLPVEICGQKKTVKLTALLDTGNELRDPITGERVLVIGAEAAKALTGISMEQLCRPLDTMQERKIPGLRLIPYRSVDAAQGMLLAMRFPRVSIDGRAGPGVVAFAPRELGNEAYQALTGGFV